MTGTRIASIGALLLGAVGTVAVAQGFVNVRASLSGYNEVVAVSTSGNGTFTARIDAANQRIDYEESYDGLEGSVTQSHIHFGAPGTNGAISVFLCSNLGNGPAGTQPCPPPPATISGTITAADVIGPGAQGIAPGQFDELVAAIRAGATYVNIHSTTWTGGEVRGQLAPGKSGQ